LCGAFKANAVVDDREKAEHALHGVLLWAPRRASCLLSPAWKHLRRLGAHLLSLIL
jgi:hypothetical protein